MLMKSKTIPFKLDADEVKDDLDADECSKTIPFKFRCWWSQRRFPSSLDADEVKDDSLQV